MTVVILGSVFAEAQQEPPPVPFPKVEQEELFLQAIEALNTGKTDTMVQLLDRAVQALKLLLDRLLQLVELLERQREEINTCGNGIGSVGTWVAAADDGACGGGDRARAPSFPPPSAIGLVVGY